MLLTRWRKQPGGPGRSRPGGSDGKSGGRRHGPCWRAARAIGAPLPSPGRYPEATALGGQGRRYSSESRCSRSGSGRRSAAQERAPKGSFSDILPKTGRFWRSEEHTSELQSLMRISYAVFCLKKKKTTPPYIQL